MRHRKQQNIPRGPNREEVVGNHYWNFVIDISAFYECGLYPINIAASAIDAKRRIIISYDVIRQMDRDKEMNVNYQRVLHFLSTYVLPHKDGEIRLDNTSFKVTSDSTMVATTRLVHDLNEYVALVVSQQKAKNFNGLVGADVIPVTKGYLPWRGWFEYKKDIGSRHEVRTDIRQCYNVIMPRRYVAISDAVSDDQCEARIYHGQLQYSIQAKPSELSSRILLEYLSDPSVRILFVGTRPERYDDYGRMIFYNSKVDGRHVVSVEPNEVRDFVAHGIGLLSSIKKSCFVIQRAQNLRYKTIKDIYESLDNIPYGQQCRIVFLYRSNEPFELPVQEFAREYVMHDRVATIEEYVPKKE